MILYSCNDPAGFMITCPCLLERKNACDPWVCCLLPLQKAAPLQSSQCHAKQTLGPWEKPTSSHRGRCYWHTHLSYTRASSSQFPVTTRTTLLRLNMHRQPVKGTGSHRVCRNILLYQPFLVHKQPKIMVTECEYVKMKADCSKGKSPCSLFNMSLLCAYKENADSQINILGV